MTRLNDIVHIYGQLEQGMQACMSSQCGRFCAKCTSSCCRVHYCAESVESPFLEKVRQSFAPDQLWDRDMGWHTARGCRLKAGRPPVCYEFLCETIINDETDAEVAKLLNQLAMLLTQVGRNAHGRRHLVEVNDLSRLNEKRLLDQLASGRLLLDAVREKLGNRVQDA